MLETVKVVHLVTNKTWNYNEVASAHYRRGFCNER
jgi:hypothetical protein